MNTSAKRSARHARAFYSTCAKAAIGLKRGDQAMVVDYDAATRTFQIEPADRYYSE